MTDLNQIFADLMERTRNPRRDDPLRLASRASAPATTDELELAERGMPVPPEIRSLWSTSAESWLFEDLDYGHWGLHLFSPGASVVRTSTEGTARPREFRLDDVVVGEFLGDGDLLLYAPSEPRERRCLIALPLDARHDWPAAGSTLAEVFERLLEAGGDKYWEASTV
ncbi:hypothetical protein [Microbacterium sp. NPDC057650]|uniref:hypothetical protein n=1 Tax=unclassified Microbacterium TaxID=2609290 RepID=UPI003671A243